MKKTIMTIIGARPQFVKAAALSRALNSNTNIKEIIVHTGQHYDFNMSDVFFEELDIPKPGYNLSIHGGSHAEMTGKMMEMLEPLLLETKPNAVMVYGDTNSTLAGALTAAKLHIPVIHIEAGLRSYNKKMPEEINRVLTDHVSELLICPSFQAVKNLEKEGIGKCAHHTGDIMYDASIYATSNNQLNSALHHKFSWLPNNFAFLTIHRAESTSTLDELSNRLEYAYNFALKHNLRIIFPVHPRLTNMLEMIKSKYAENICCIEPLSYFETQYLLNLAKYVLTDSGGLQKEAYFHKVPCITLRAETEWVETIENGWNRLWTNENYAERNAIHDYGKGDAAQKILKLLESFV